MAKAAKAGEKTEKNGALVFEKMGKDFDIPARVRLHSAYSETVDALKGTKEVVTVFKSEEAKPANTRRKSLIMAAEARGVWIHAAVRNINGVNYLLAQYKGDLKDKPAKEE